MAGQSRIKALKDLGQAARDFTRAPWAKRERQDIVNVGGACGVASIRHRHKLGPTPSLEEERTVQDRYLLFAALHTAIFHKNMWQAMQEDAEAKRKELIDQWGLSESNLSASEIQRLERALRKAADPNLLFTLHPGNGQLRYLFEIEDAASRYPVISMRGRNGASRHFQLVHSTASSLDGEPVELSWPSGYKGMAFRELVADKDTGRPTQQTANSSYVILHSGARFPPHKHSQDLKAIGLAVLGFEHQQAKDAPRFLEQAMARFKALEHSCPHPARENGKQPKIRFIGHSLGGMNNSYAMAYLYARHREGRADFRPGQIVHIDAVAGLSGARHAVDQLAAYAREQQWRDDTGKPLTRESLDRWMEKHSMWCGPVPFSLASSIEIVGYESPCWLPNVGEKGFNLIDPVMFEYCKREGMLKPMEELTPRQQARNLRFAASYLTAGHVIAPTARKLFHDITHDAHSPNKDRREIQICRATPTSLERVRNNPSPNAADRLDAAIHSAARRFFGEQKPTLFHALRGTDKYIPAPRKDYAGDERARNAAERVTRERGPDAWRSAGAL